MGGYESATVRVEPSGKVKVFVGVSSHGQGHETTFAQIAADELGIPLEDITVHHGDTYADPFGTGTFESRSAVIGGGAVIRATRDMRDRVLRIAAHMLEAMEKGGTEVYRLTDAEHELLDEALEEANRGVFVSDEDMDKFWNRHRV